jgi:uncharacterized membrane protein YeaQ/YmgE (transglycosylase-associated protein family)
MAMHLTVVSIVVLCVIAGVCGAIGAVLARRSEVGCVGSIALGFIGALLGTWIARQMHLPEVLTIRVGGESFPVVWSIVGSALFVGVLSLLTTRSKRKRRRDEDDD